MTISETMISFAALASLLESTVGYAVLYYDQAQEVWMRNAPEVHDQVKGYIDTLTQYVADIKSWDQDLAINLDNFKALNERNLVLDDVIIKLNIVNDIYREPKWLALATIGVSMTKVGSVREAIAIVERNTDRLSESITEYELHVFPRITTLSDPGRYSEIVNMITEHPISRLGMNTLRRIIPKATRQVQDTIIDYINRKCDNVLGASRVSKQDLGKYHFLQSYPRHGLVPITDMMLVKELLPMMTDKPAVITQDIVTGGSDGDDGDGSNDVVSVFKSWLVENHPRTMGMVIIDKSNIGSSLYFDVRPLISSNYILGNDLVTTGNSGINKKVVKRSQTINKVSRIDTAATTSHKSELSKKGILILTHDDVEDLNVLTHCFVIETYDHGNTWRLRGYDSTQQPQQLYINASSIMSLLHGTTTRPVRYNAIQQRKIIATCIDKRMYSRVLDYDNLSSINDSAITTSIIQYLKTTNDFDDVLSHDTHKDLISNLTSHKMVDKVVSTVSDVFDSVVSSNGITPAKYDRIKSGDFMLSRLMKQRGVLIGFEREWLNHINKWDIKDHKLKSFSDKDRIAFVRGMLISSMESVLERMRRHKSWEHANTSLKEYLWTR